MSTRDLTLSALFAAIVIVLGIVPPIMIGIIPVPITLQSLGVMLAGCIIGARRAALAYVIFVALAAAGLPVLSGGRGGLAVLFGPTGGYIFGWIVAAFVTGLVAERFVRDHQDGWRPLAGFVVASLVGGIVVLYPIGMVWLSVVAGTPLSTIAAGSLVFIPGDILKAVVAGLAARAVLAGYPLLQRA